jgi:hypothetical protein
VLGVGHAVERVKEKSDEPQFGAQALDERCFKSIEAGPSQGQPEVGREVRSIAAEPSELQNECQKKQLPVALVTPMAHLHDSADEPLWSFDCLNLGSLSIGQIKVLAELIPCFPTSVDD